MRKFKWAPQTTILIPFNPSIFLPFWIFANILNGCIRFRLLKKNDYLRQLIIGMCTFNILWILGSSVYFNGTVAESNLKLMVEFFIPLIFCFIYFGNYCGKDFIKSFYLLAIIDAIFNFYFYNIAGGDPLGRVELLDGVRQRYGGIFGNPYYSLNIQIIGLFAAVFLRKKILLVPPLLVICLSTSARGLFDLAAIIVLATLYSTRVRIFIKQITPIAIALIIPAIIYLSQFYKPEFFKLIRVDLVESNSLRYCAWTNSLKNIVDNPFFGKQDFLYGNSTTVMTSCTDIIDYGVAESRVLQIAQNYGLIPSLFSVLIPFVAFIFVMNKWGVKKYLVCKVYLGFVIYDIFFGTFYGSALTAIFTWGIFFYTLQISSSFENFFVDKKSVKYE